MIRPPTTDTDHKALHLYLVAFGAAPAELVGGRDSSEAVREEQRVVIRLTREGLEIRIRRGKKAIKVISAAPTWPKQRDEALEKWRAKK